jgi:hypothetical protein
MKGLMDKRQRAAQHDQYENQSRKSFRHRF